MAKFLLGVGVGAALGGVGLFALVEFAQAHLPLRGDDAQANARPGPVTIVLARDGGRVVAGTDDPGTLRSGVVARHGVASIDVPAFTGSDREWKRLVRCVEDRFADFAVDIVDSPPAHDEYALALIGGRPSLFGFERTVGGIAPHAGEPIRTAVLFVFEDLKADPVRLCETTAHEIGHVLGLDHSRLCSDIMSYEACGPKAFRREAAPCGEWDERACENGEPTQSSYDALMQLVGPRRRDGSDTEAPRIAIRSADPRPFA